MIIGHAAYLTCVCSDHMEAGIDLLACGTWLFAFLPSTGTACVCVLSFQTRLLCGTRFSRVLQNLHRVSRRDPSVHQVTPSHGHLSPLHWRRTVVHQNKSQVRAQCHHSASLKNLDLILARFFATKIFDNQHRLPTLTGKSHQLLFG